MNDFESCARSIAGTDMTEAGEEGGVVRQVPDDATATASDGAAARAAGRVELRRLINKAYALLKREGAPQAVRDDVTWKNSLFRGTRFSASGGAVGFAVDGGWCIFLDDGRLCERNGVGPMAAYGLEHQGAVAASTHFEAKQPGAVFVDVARKSPGILRSQRVIAASSSSVTVSWCPGPSETRLWNRQVPS